MRNPIEEEEAETDPLQVEQADLQEERRPFGKVWINGKNPSPIGDVLNNFHGQENYKTRCVCLFSLVGQSWMIFQARLTQRTPPIWAAIFRSKLKWEFLPEGTSQGKFFFDL